jgi:glyoxylase-like metal-dependent hydrolase (beta-lactamase superfamily II)
MWQGDMGVINPLVEGDDALERAIETLERIARLDVETVYPGHGPVITSPKPVIERLQRKLDRYQKEPKLMHDDHLRKMIAYIILLRDGVREADFFAYLMASVWYPKLVDRYFDSAYDEVYRTTIESVLRSRMAVREDGYLRGVGKK